MMLHIFQHSMACMPSVRLRAWDSVLTELTHSHKMVGGRKSDAWCKSGDSGLSGAVGILPDAQHTAS